MQRKAKKPSTDHITASPLRGVERVAVNHNKEPVITLRSALSVAQCSDNDFQNWRRRGLLVREFGDSAPKKNRWLTRRQALTLTIIAALMHARVASYLLELLPLEWLELDAKGELRGFFLVDPRTQRHCLYPVTEKELKEHGPPNLYELFAVFGAVKPRREQEVARLTESHRGAKVLTAINVDEIVQAIDEAFAETAYGDNKDSS